MNTLRQDLRFAIRQLINHRAMTLAAAFTLALGIGANTSMFTLMNAAFFRTAPAAEPAALRWITSVGGRSREYRNMSYPDYIDVRDRAKTFRGVLAYGHVWMSFGGAVPERIRGELVSGNYFDVLGVRAARGRTFRPEEDGAAGANPVVVLSDDFWRRRLGGDAGIVNRTITINGHQFTVIGIAPPGFRGVEMSDDEPQAIWVPMAMIAAAQPGMEGELTDRYSSGFVRVIGRLADGATTEQVNAELAVLAPQLRADARNAEDRIGLAALPVVGGMDPSNRGQLLPILSLLMAVPALVLLVACANAANVLLAHGMARRREIAVRRALGASRTRLIRQLLTESVLLSVVAGGIGVILSFWMTTLIARLGDVPPAIVAEMTLDGNVLTATAVLAIVAGALFGLAPALTATRPSLVPALKAEAVTLQLGGRRIRLRDVFLSGQIAVSLVLLVTAGLFGRSLSRSLHVNPGFTARSGVYLSFDLGLQGYTAARQAGFERELLARAAGLAGVESVALVSSPPFGNNFEGGDAKADGQPDDARGVMQYGARVTPGFLRTLGIGLVAGRGFSDADNAASTPVVIISETLARRLWPNADPVGKRVRFGAGNGTVREVVGVVRDMRYQNLMDPPPALAFVPQPQQPARALVLVVRTAGPGEPMLNAVRTMAQAIDPDLPLYNAKTFERALHDAAGAQKAASSMLGVFGLLALTLAGLGMFSVTAHAVALRTREIGIRMSLGAKAADVRALFVREGMGRALVGVGIGLVLSLALSKVLGGFLFGLGAIDIVTFASGAAILCAVAAAASYIPARRASRVDPMEALRVE